MSDCVFERRLIVLRKRCNTKTPFEVGPYPSDLDEIGCNINVKTCPVVLVMLPRPEKVKRISCLMSFERFENCLHGKLLHTLLLYTHFLMFNSGNPTRAMVYPCAWLCGLYLQDHLCQMYY
jgi:hypothetical protein